MRSLLIKLKPFLHITYENVYKISSAQQIFNRSRYTGENVFQLL